MIVGTHIAHGTVVTVDIHKTPVERIQMIFKDVGVHTVSLVTGPCLFV